MTVANGQLLTTPAVLDRMAQTFADHDAVVTDERTFTFAELREEVRGTALHHREVALMFAHDHRQQVARQTRKFFFKSTKQCGGLLDQVGDLF